MEPISTAIATAVATGLVKDAVKVGYEKLKELIFGSSPEQKMALEAAIIAIEKAKAELENLLTTSGVTQNVDMLNQAAELLKAAGNHIVVMGNQNATSAEGSKAVVVAGNTGDINL